MAVALPPAAAGLQQALAGSCFPASAAALPAAAASTRCRSAPETHLREAAIVPADACLVVIDVQNYCCHRDAPDAAECGTYFWHAVEEVALPNLQRLLAACRHRGVEVIYTTIESLTADGRERSVDYKISGFVVPKGDWGARVARAVAPEGDEIVLPKGSSSVFVSTNLNYLLRQMGKRQVVLCGGLTDQCVDSAVRDACDLGYLVTTVTDACFTHSKERHDAALTLHKGYCRHRTTEQMVVELAATAAVPHPLPRVTAGDDPILSPATTSAAATGARAGEAAPAPTSSARAASAPPPTTCDAAPSLPRTSAQPPPARPAGRAVCSQETSSTSEQAAQDGQSVCQTVSANPTEQAVGENILNFDFVRYYVCDFHGVARCKVVSQRAMRDLDVHRQGTGMYAGTVLLHTNNSIFVKPAEIVEQGYGDVRARPFPATCRALPWAGAGRHRVGAVMCETVWCGGGAQRGGAEGAPPAAAPPRAQEACPRFAARTLHDRLAREHGLALLHAAEYEFRVWGDRVGDPAFPNDAFFSAQALAPLEPRLMDLSQHLAGAGVPVETLQCEFGHGQVEVVLAPQRGIAGADAEFLLKAAVKELFQEKATFMSFPVLGDIGSSCHYNHSLWFAPEAAAGDGGATRRGGDAAAMWDESIGDGGEVWHGLSERAAAWLAGQLEHAAAVAAFAAPTPNCWRRLHQDFTPCSATWGVGCRMDEAGKGVMVRVKAEGPGRGTYFENRLGSAAANPYLMMAATIAAGIDGLRRRLPLPAPGAGGGRPLPTSLAGALDALEADEGLRDLLPAQLVRWYVALKRQEIEALRSNASPEECHAAELKMYAKYI